MGYTTEFSGEIAIVPPLNAEEIEFINKFASSRRVQRTQGPYYVEDDDCGKLKPGSNSFGGEGVTDMNSPPEGQPGLWCQWIATDDGAAITWDGGEKFYHSEEWMRYIITHFLGFAPMAKAKHPQEFAFLQGHTLNGEIEAQGEDADDMWKLIVADNVVSAKSGRKVYD
jgi:hypothetical protein